MGIGRHKPDWHPDSEVFLRLEEGCLKTAAVLPQSHSRFSRPEGERERNSLIVMQDSARR